MIVSVIYVASFITIEAFGINGKNSITRSILCIINPTSISANHMIGLRFSQKPKYLVFLGQPDFIYMHWA